MKKETIERIRKFTADRDWDKFHSPANLAKSISIEANELLECFQWNEDSFDLEEVKEELADVLVYCRNMLDKLELDEDEIINAKMAKNEAKYPVDKSKGKADKYDKLPTNDEEVEIIAEKESEKSKIDRTYYCILCEMSNFPYKGSEVERALAKEVKKYLLDILNSQTKDGKGKMYDPIFACSVASFHGHHLSWNKNSWKRSAAIVYNYFKAKTLIECIKDYEKVFNKTIVHDYKGLLHYFYEAISKLEEIDYWKAPGIDSAFQYVPEETLNEKLHRFKELYE